MRHTTTMTSHEIRTSAAALKSYQDAVLTGCIACPFCDDVGAHESTLVGKRLRHFRCRSCRRPFSAALY